MHLRPSGTRATVRLGGFASASLKRSVAEAFGKGTLFHIWTCTGDPIKGYSFYPGEEEVLIPPFETFQVINASRPAQGPSRIYLRALGKRSTYNCEYIKGEQGTCQPAAVHKVGFPIPFSGHTYTDIKISEEDLILSLAAPPFPSKAEHNLPYPGGV